MASVATMLVSFNISPLNPLQYTIIYVLIIVAALYKLRSYKLWTYLLCSMLLKVILTYLCEKGLFYYIGFAYIEVLIAVISCVPLFVLYIKNKKYKKELLIISCINVLIPILIYFFNFNFTDYNGTNLGIYIFFAFCVLFLLVSSIETTDKNTKYTSFAGIVGIILFFVFGIINIISVYCKQPEDYYSKIDILLYEDQAQQYPTLTFVMKFFEIQGFVLLLASVLFSSFFFTLLKRSEWTLEKECVPIIISSLSLIYFIRQNSYNLISNMLWEAIFALFAYSFYKLYQKL